MAHIDERKLVTSFYPFGATAANHPEIVCKLDQGIVRGLMESTSTDSAAIVTPHSKEEEDCIAQV